VNIRHVSHLPLAAKVLAGKVALTRPLCAYPEVARYKGTGDTREAANFNRAAG
jgi:feruloyl esterase